MSDRTRTGSVIVGLMAAVLLLAGVFVAGVRVGRPGDGGPDDSHRATPAGNPGTSPGAGAGPTAGGDGGGGGTPKAPDIEATARAVAYHGDIEAVTSLRLLGGADVSVLGDVTDAAGVHLGEGTLAASGAELTLSGGSFVVAVRTELRLAGGVVTVTSDGVLTELLRIRRAARLTLNASDVRFAPNQSKAPQRPVAGPVTVVTADSDVTIRGHDLKWADAPPALRFTTEDTRRTTLSWAGDGVIRAGGRENRTGFLGLNARQLHVAVERDAAVVRLRGDAQFLQVYADGLPQLPTQGRIRIKSNPGAVARGGTGSFTWAPENDGVADMTISRARPNNPDAAWVSLGLSSLPAMCGGESCPVRGGETTGLRSGKPIAAVIAPGTGDERDITFSVPASTPLGSRTIVLVAEGNFEPIRVEVPFEVVEPVRTTRPAAP